MNDEAVVEVVAVLLLYHVQLLEPQVHVEDGLNTVDDLTEIIIEFKSCIECNTFLPITISSKLILKVCHVIIRHTPATRY